MQFVRSRGMNAEFSHPFTIDEYVAERYEISRDFAALRAQSLPVWKRLLAAATRIALPPLVLARIVARVLRRQYVTALAMALPWMIFFTLVQMAGEMVGYAMPGKLEARGLKGAAGGK
jgi:hypothetical protein